MAQSGSILRQNANLKSAEMPFLCTRCSVVHSLGGKNKVARNEKRKKLHGFSYSKSIANFEAFRWNISSSINFLFLKSDIRYTYSQIDIRPDET